MTKYGDLNSSTKTIVERNARENKESLEKKLTNMDEIFNTVILSEQRQSQISFLKVMANIKPVLENTKKIRQIKLNWEDNFNKQFLVILDKADELMSFKFKNLQHLEKIEINQKPRGLSVGLKKDKISERKIDLHYQNRFCLSKKDLSLKQRIDDFSVRTSFKTLKPIEKKAGR